MASSGLWVLKDDGETQIQAGDGLTHQYAITVTNSGPSLANNVVLTDTWPLDLARGSVGSSQGTCDTSTSPSNFTCSLGSLPVGSQAAITATYTVAASISAGTYTNQVAVNSPDSNAPASASDATVVDTVAGLTVVKSDGLDSVIAGDGLTHQYAITVTNTGPSLASSVVMTDTWPAGLTRGGLTTSQGSCNAATSDSFTCVLGALPVGSQAAITATYSVPSDTPAGTYTNQVEARTPEADAPILASDITQVDVSASLGIAKSDGLDSVIAGDGLTHQYAITVTNSGPSLASSVVVTDTWPAGFLRGPVLASQGACDTSTSSIDFTCSLGSIPVGAGAAITATFTVPADAPIGTHTNQAVVRSPGDTLSHTATDETTVVASASLGIVKSDGISSVVAGDGLAHQYAITVTNSGPSLASSVLVTDTWPVELLRETVLTSQGACDTNTSPSDFVCSLGSLMPGSQAAITATYSVPSDTAIDSYTNQAEARTPEDTNSVAAYDITSVSASSSLEIAMSDGLESVVAGDGITHTYAVTVSNTGPSLASSVVVTDTWPAEFSRGTPTSSQGSCDPGDGLTDFNCVLGSLPVGEQAAITVTYSTPADIPSGVYVNLAQAVTPEASASALVTDTTRVAARADLLVLKSDGVSAVVAGDGITYSYVITVSNMGPSLAKSIILTDTWPLEFEQGALATSQGSCDPVDGSGDFTCALDSLKVGSQAAITATYTVPSITPVGVYMNQVVVSSPATRLPASAMDETTVKASTGLWVVKSDGATNVIAGDGIEHHYILTVGNAGPSFANSVAITDTWPAGLVRFQVSSSEGNCDTTSSPDDFTCIVSSMPVGSEATITATYTVPPDALSGKYTNQAQVGSIEGGVGNLGVDNTTVRAVAGLGVAVGGGKGGMVAGDGILYHYAITVTNSGPSLARNVIVTDTWPAEFERQAVISSLGSCDTGSSSGNFTCSLGNLPGGEQSTISITYALPPGVVPGTYTNRVQVGSIAEDPDLGDNTDSLDTIVEAKSNIGIDLSHYPETIVAGEFLTYTLEISNGGPSDATSVMARDVLPAGFTFNHARSSPECTEDSGVVRCQLGNLDPGSNNQILIVVQVDINIKGTIVNQVTVSASSSDPYPADNQAETPTTILEPDLEPPALTWILPVTDEKIYDVRCEIVRLKVDATDNAEVQSVNFYRWDTLVGTEGAYMDIGIDGSAPYQWDFSTCELNPKYNQVFATAIDSSGNKSIRKRILLYRTNMIFLPLVNR